MLPAHIQNLNLTTTLPNIIPPHPFITEDEFFKTWCSWKNEFLTFKRVLNKENFNNQNRLGNLLLNLMGPIGQNIYSTFQFNSLNDKENVDILLEKFDEYYIFSGRKKLSLENTYEYINDLQVKKIFKFITKILIRNIIYNNFSYYIIFFFSLLSKKKTLTMNKN